MSIGNMCTLRTIEPVFLLRRFHWITKINVRLLLRSIISLIRFSIFTAVDVNFTVEVKTKSRVSTETYVLIGIKESFVLKFICAVFLQDVGDNSSPKFPIL